MGTETFGGIIRTGLPGSYSYTVKPSAVGQGPGGSEYTYADKPVVFVSSFDAIRFVNWLHNGQGSGNTEDGAYTLVGGAPIPTNGDSAARNLGARWWLPNDNEWHKAAYFDSSSGDYCNYPTGDNTIPNNSLPSADTGNSANITDQNGKYATGNANYPMTDAGAYILSASPYGTFDQGGNVWEWNETMQLIANRPYRVIRGGSWRLGFNFLHAAGLGGADSKLAYDHIGFRVATLIPEPSTLLLSAFGVPPKSSKTDQSGVDPRRRQSTRIGTHAWRPRRPTFSDTALSTA
jgi:formylglycine-generating enzyme required for sulfatase activity